MITKLYFHFNLQWEKSFDTIEQFSNFVPHTGHVRFYSKFQIEKKTEVMLSAS